MGDNTLKKKLPKRVYAYRITAGTVAKVGGTVHAYSMDEAMKVIAQVNKLTIKKDFASIRPCDGSFIQPANWVMDGMKVNVSVYAPAEYFTDSVPEY